MASRSAPGSRAAALAALFFALAVPRAANAGGFDAFIWHTARHMGTAGAATSYVSDPAAVFHNPAGLAHVHDAELLVSAGVLRPSLTSAPAPDVNTTAEPMAAPFGLLGAAFEVSDPLSAGIAVYPIAAAGATYRYDGVLGPMDDKTRAVLIEASPAVAVALPEGFRLGIGYRFTGMMMRRFSGADAAEQPGIDMRMTGVNGAGFRVGGQWSIDDGASAIDQRAFHAGVSYRHVVRVRVTGDEGYALATPLTEVETTFVLPSRLALGVRGDYGRFGATMDFEYSFNSQNDRGTVAAMLEDGREVELPNVYGWQDTPGVRGGVEWRALDDGSLPVRIGYAYDGQTVTAAYPTPFGPPPASTQMVTLGAGYVSERWELNGAASFRFGSREVTEADVEDSELCAFCGYPGEYEAQIFGAYVDFTYHIGGAE